MVTKKVIDTIYKTCKHRPASPEELDIALLFEQLPIEHAIGIDGDSLIIGSIPGGSPSTVHFRQERPSIIDRLRYNLSNPEQ